jgi:hypothetical protein
MIRVGRRIYTETGFVDPSYPNFIPILVLTKCTEYGDELGPYDLKDEEGRIFENIWQFSKIYNYVPPTTCVYSRFDKTVTWNHPHEVHIEKDIPTPAYWKWKEKGFNNPYYVRYPVGFKHRGQCVGALKQYEMENKNPIYIMLDYVESRKEIYLPEYVRLVKTKPKFEKLRKMLKEGKNLLIIEVDGPHQENLEYYKEKYDVGDDFIVNNTMLATKENLDIMLNDTLHPFGHGYCLAVALQSV